MKYHNSNNILYNNHKPTLYINPTAILYITDKTCDPLSALSVPHRRVPCYFLNGCFYAENLREKLVQKDDLNLQINSALKCKLFH